MLYYGDMKTQDTVELPCKEKLAFDTKKQAAATATVVQYRYGTIVRPYKCRHCDLWHLSSAPR
jgi:hypothetical protein